MITALHVLDHFIPISSGYTFRSRYMLANQKRVLGIQPVVVTSTRHEAILNQNEWEGIPIYTTPSSIANGHSLIAELRNMHRLSRRILEVARLVKADVIHAHSPVLNAWPAWWAARELKIPVVYEIRAFWEDAAVLHGTTEQDSLRYRTTRMLETLACRRMDAVVTICEGLKSQLLDRKIAKNKIFVLPNGVDPEKFRPGADALKVRAQLKLGTDPVIGFIGSLYRYEGLPLLIEAMSVLRKKVPNLRCLIVGEGFGAEEKELRNQASRLGVTDSIIFTGKVPHESILEYYAAIDILVYPRIKSRLLDLVTPLKILEALALSKPVIGSDVGGIQEILKDQVNGRLFHADDKEDLVATLMELIGNRNEQARLGENGRAYVLANRDWAQLIESHRDTYRSIGLSI
jgi:glycogen synthase